MKMEQLLLRASMMMAACWPGMGLAAAVTLTISNTQGERLADAVVALQANADSARPAVLANDAPQAIMDQRDRQFDPHVLVIRTGTAVSFPNSDNIRHHVYSFSKPKPFEIKLYHGTPSAPVVFEQPGLVTLGCNIHDQMLGYIYIVDTALFAKTDASGRATLTDIPAGRYTLSLWHPDLGLEQAPLTHSVSLSDQDVESLAFSLPIRSKSAPQLTPLEEKFRSKSRNAN